MSYMRPHFVPVTMILHSQTTYFVNHYSLNWLEVMTELICEMYVF